MSWSCATGTPADILLVEDNPGDVRLTEEAFKAGRIANALYVVNDGSEALDLLYRYEEYADAPRPDLVLLDLSLTRIDGDEVLAEISDDSDRSTVPVIVLSCSSAHIDHAKSDGFEDVCDDLQMRIEASDATITTDSLPSVEGDPTQLRQVFQNLLDDVITYSGDDPPVIHASARRNGTDWIVTAQAEGIGINPKDQDRLFDIFKQAHNRREGTGTGIGLALCERIVERQGGDIWVESESGAGSAFSFTLPAGIS